MRLDALFRAMAPVFVLIAAIWAAELANALLDHRLNRWLGLRPRSLPGLVGVPAMPFLHSSFGHVIANTLPLAFLGAVGTLVAPRRFWALTAAIVTGTGLAVWLMGRPDTIHVGASGLVFGWFGFVLALGFIERSARAVAGALVVIAVYGGMIWGVLPQRGVPTSWEAHVFGALVGAGVAYLYRGRP